MVFFITILLIFILNNGRIGLDIEENNFKDKGEGIMTYNVRVLSAAMYETFGKSKEVVSYPARLIYMHSGGIVAGVDGEKKKTLSPGNLLYIPSGVKYKLKGEYFKAVVINFTFGEAPFSIDEERPISPDAFDLNKKVNAPAPFDKTVFIEDMLADGPDFEKIANLYVSCEGLYKEKADAALELLLLKLAETVGDDALPSRMVEALDSYIRENMSDEISNTEIGAIFGYHPFYVSRMLKDKKGMTMRQYVIKHRLSLATNMLLYTDKTINEIAEETGFTDASYFTKTFKSYFGMTPKEYRNNNKPDTL